jgi:D-alanyl-D-alanine carboxypeptidase (penicillin-binding protein 5/6)
MAQPGRMGRRLLPLAFVLCALASLVVPRVAYAAPVAPASQPPNAYILVDADTGKVLAARNDHAPQLTASTVKLLTALTALERLPLDSDVPVTARSAAQPAMRINMKQGEIWKLDDALHSMIMVSANDAAFAIAERTSGTVEQFAKDADATAKRLGAPDTTFGDPAGLDDKSSFAGGSRMSAYDLAVVARNALAVPEIATPAKLLSYTFTDPTGLQRSLPNHNDGFLTTYPGATGLKTGFTKRANRTLVTSATRDGRTMIAVVLGTWDDTGWAGFLLDQGFSTPAAAPGTGAVLPPVRVATADMRRQAFEGLPAALGRPALDGSASVPISATRPVRTAGGSRRTDSSTGREQTAAPKPATTGSSSSTLGLIFNVRNLVIVIVLVLLVLFLLRRRAVRRQRKRRIARQQRMAEVRRRRMIDIIEPRDQNSHVRVVPVREQRRSSAV